MSPLYVIICLMQPNNQSNLNGRISTTFGTKTLERISTKLGIYNYVVSMITYRGDNVGGLSEHVTCHMS